MEGVIVSPPPRACFPPQTVWFLSVLLLLPSFREEAALCFHFLNTAGTRVWTHSAPVGRDDGPVGLCVCVYSVCTVCV